MTHEARIRRIGWFAILAVCAALTLGLHLMVNKVKSDLVLAERRIVQLEQQTLLMETEFLARSSQLQLSRWNRVEFGYRPPEASQFIASGQQLAALGTRHGPVPGMRDSETIRLASYNPNENPPAAQEQADDAELALVSPLTGRPVDPALLVAGRERANRAETPRLALLVPNGPTRIQLAGSQD